MNQIILVGRLTRDAEIRYTTGENAMPIARFSLAVERKFKRQGESDADFINCVCFGKRAGVIENHVKKGTKLLVQGRLQTGSYTNKDGQKVYTNDVVVEDFEFCEKKMQPAEQEPNDTKIRGNRETDGFMDIPDIAEELPFN